MPSANMEKPDRRQAFCNLLTKLYTDYELDVLTYGIAVCKDHYANYIHIYLCVYILLYAVTQCSTLFININDSLKDLYFVDSIYFSFFI